MTAPPQAATTSPREAALGYAAAGLRVFPTHGKAPRVAWQEDATTDPAITGAWWDRWPDAGIGWLLPPRVLAVDLDPPDGAD